MQVAQMPKMSPGGIPVPLFAVGADIGAANVKLVLDCGEIKIPSALEYLSSPPETILVGRDGGHVHYLEGSREDLIGRRWYAGGVAVKANPKGHHKVSDDASQNKPGLGLQLLLAALTQFTYRSIWNLKVVASIHDAGSLKLQLKQALEGTHHVVLGRHTQTSQVNISVTAVVNEGFGLVVSQQHRIPEHSEVIALDLGGHSTIATVFDGFGQIVDRYPVQIGVIDLLESIAKNPMMRERCHGQQGDLSLIRAALESPNSLFQYGFGQSAFSLQDIYETELQPWLDAALSKAWRSVEDYRARASHYFAIGGGVSLPYVQACLTEAGLECLPESEWVNARGLYTLAAAN